MVIVLLKKITVSFLKPIAPGNRLKVVMKDMKISGRSNAWLYPVLVKIVSINASIPLGLAQFRIYIMAKLFLGL